MKNVAIYVVSLLTALQVVAAERSIKKIDSSLPRCVLKDNARDLPNGAMDAPEGRYRAEVYIGEYRHASFEADGTRPYQGRAYPSEVSELVAKANHLAQILTLQARRNAEVEIRLLVLEGRCRR